MTMSTERIRQFYMHSTGWNMNQETDSPVLPALRARLAAEFDEWLETVKADAYDEGRADLLKDAACQLEHQGHPDAADVLINDIAPDVLHADRMSQRANPNPYRKEGT